MAQIGSLWIYPLTTAVVLSGDEANIGKYEFNTRMLHKTFCKICGVGMTNNFNAITEEQVAALPEVMRNLYKARHMYTGVNARVLHGVDVSKLNTVKADGLNKIPGNYVNP